MLGRELEHKMQALELGDGAQVGDGDYDEVSIMLRLIRLYGPPRAMSPYGQSIVIPNGLLTKGLSQYLERAKVKVFSGHEDGKVVWIVPLDQHVRGEPPGGKAEAPAYSSLCHTVTHYRAPKLSQDCNLGKLEGKQKDG